MGNTFFNAIRLSLVSLLRLVAFLASLLLLAIAIQMSYQAVSLRQFWLLMLAYDWTPKANQLFLESAYLGALALMGMVGCLWGHRDIIKLFGFMAAIDCLCCVYLLVTLPDPIQNANKFEPILSASQAYYNWSSPDPTRPFPPRPPIPPPALGSPVIIMSQPIPRLLLSLGKLNHINGTYLEPTKLWDQIQRDFHCCGLANTEDWFKYSPYSHYYPKSCCLHQSVIRHPERESKYFCAQLDDEHQVSCQIGISRPLTEANWSLALALFLNFSLSLFTLIIGLLSDGNDVSVNSTRLRASNTTGDIRSALHRDGGRLPIYPTAPMNSNYHSYDPPPKYPGNTNVPPCYYGSTMVPNQIQHSPLGTEAPFYPVTIGATS